MLKKIWLIEPPAPDCHVFSFSDLPRLGLPILGTILKQLGYQVTIHTPVSGALSIEELLTADLVGFSLTTATAPAGYHLADDIRRRAEAAGRRLPVVFGGVHATFMPEEGLAHGDFVIRGEAEESFPALLEALAMGKDPSNLAGLSCRREGRIVHNPPAPRPNDLDRIPIPDLSLIRHYKPRVSPVVTSRGCPHACTFCCVTRMMGHHYRYAGTERVLAELRQLPSKSVFFYDDNFAADPARTRALLQRMIDEDLRLEWSAQVRADVAEDPGLLKLMHRSGGQFLYIGLESVNDEALHEFRKGQTVEAVARNLARLKENGFGIHGMFILGADSDRPETIRRTTDFALQHQLDSAQFMALTPLPGTPLYARLCREGRLLTGDWRRYDGANVVFRPKGMSAQELQVLVCGAVRRFYSWGSLLRHSLARRWTQAGLVLYARHTLNRWLRHHRPDFKALKLLDNTE